MRRVSAMTAVAEQGALPGLPDARMIERGEDDPGPPPGRSFCDRQGCRWMTGMQRSGELLGRRPW